MKNHLLPDIVTADEAAGYLRVSKATILRLANRGTIQGVRIGRQWRFSRRVILSLVSKPELLQKIGATV